MGIHNKVSRAKVKEPSMASSSSSKRDLRPTLSLGRYSSDHENRRCCREPLSFFKQNSCGILRTSTSSAPLSVMLRRASTSNTITSQAQTAQTQTAQTAQTAQKKLPTLEQVCRICQTNGKDLAFGCGHKFCRECGLGLSNCPICWRPIYLRIFTG